MNSILLFITFIPLVLAGPTQQYTTGRKVMIFSQKDGSYLGCLTCSKDDPESILNGSPIFLEPHDSDYSPCNPNAKFPPITRDEFGYEYGELTVDDQRSTAFKGDKMREFLEDFVCSDKGEDDGG